MAYILGLTHDDPDKLLESPLFGFPSLLYLAWRIFTAAFFMVVVVWSWLVSNGISWWFYLTNWTIYVLLNSCILLALLSIHHYYIRVCKGNNSRRQMNFLLKLAWALNNITYPISIIVTVIYWTSVYTGYELTFPDVSVHAFNTVYVLLDILVTGMPIYMSHIYFPICYSATYGTFTIIFYLSGGVNYQGKPYLYKVIDYSTSWSKSIMVQLGLAIFIIINFSVFAVITRIKYYVTNKKLEIAANIGYVLTDSQNTTNTPTQLSMQIIIPEVQV